MGYNTTGTRTRNSDARGAQQTRSTRELRVGPARAGTKESAMIHGFEEMSHGFEECHDSWYRFQNWLGAHDSWSARLAGFRGAR